MVPLWCVAAAALLCSCADADDWISLDPVPTPWPIIAEAENFTVVGPAGRTWGVTPWGGDHLYGATFSNTFASRKALLHSTAGASGTATSSAIYVPAAGTWYVCVRYEAAYRFETEFTVAVRQGGAAKLTKIYGAHRTRPTQNCRRASAMFRIFFL